MAKYNRRKISNKQKEWCCVRHGWIRKRTMYSDAMTLLTLIMICVDIFLVLHFLELWFFKCSNITNTITFFNTFDFFLTNLHHYKCIIYITLQIRIITLSYLQYKHDLFVYISYLCFLTKLCHMFNLSNINKNHNEQNNDTMSNHWTNKQLNGKLTRQTRTNKPIQKD